MTADAKVGLLLGLVFIVIIAFLINGLPNFLKAVSPEDVLDTAIEMPTHQELVIDPRIVETARGLQESEVPLRQTTPPQEVVVLDDSSSGLGSVEPIQPQPQVAVQVPDIPVETNQPEPITEKARIHVVQPGENLAVIAQKYYGKEEGNRRIVIHKIYEWNALTLDSEDKVRVGDKLTIPTLDQMFSKPSKTVSSTKTPEKTLLEKFSDFFEPSSKANTTRGYVVQIGDTLWGISEKTLGDGKRYKEIIKLNKDIKNADGLVAGMKLKLPDK